MRALKKTILKFVDFFYPLAKWIFPLETYRYAAFGMINVLLDFCISNYSYYIVYHGDEKTLLPIIHLHIFTHTLANFTSACIMIPLGFVIMSVFVFPEAILKKHHQLMRYGMVTLINFFAVILLTKFFVEVCGLVFWSAKIIVTGITVIGSYIAQTKFTFKKK